MTKYFLKQKNFAENYYIKKFLRAEKIFLKLCYNRPPKKQVRRKDVAVKEKNKGMFK
jgi:hypothetical protein